MSENTQIDFIYLSEPDMIKAGVKNMSGCVDAMEDMFALLHKGDYRMAGENNDSHGAMVTFPENPEIATMPRHTPDRRLMAMPAYLGGDYQTCGVKWYGSNIANREKGLPRSILMFTLNDIDTGAPLAHMSANLLSAYRTGAVPGVGARHLARKDSKVVGLLGPGVMGKTSIAAFMAVCPQIDTLKIKGRGQKSLDSFLSWVKESFPQIANVQVVDTLEDVVRDADIVTYCNSGETGDISSYPEIKREWVKPGAFISMPAYCRLDQGLEESDVRKVMDNIGLYEAWHDEVPKPAHKLMTKDQLEDLGSIVTATSPGRQNDQEIIVLSVGGLPTEDVAWATKIYHNAMKHNIGVKLNLWETPELS